MLNEDVLLLTTFMSDRLVSVCCLGNYQCFLCLLQHWCKHIYTLQINYAFLLYNLIIIVHIVLIIYM